MLAPHASASNTRVAWPVTMLLPAYIPWGNQHGAANGAGINMCFFRTVLLHASAPILRVSAGGAIKSGDGDVLLRDQPNPSRPLPGARLLMGTNMELEGRQLLRFVVLYLFHAKALG